MAANNIMGKSYWGYLINLDKSATPRLQQLCVGLAEIIANLEPPNAGPKKKLTPQRLAEFYRSVGANFDNLFLNRSSAGLSVIYVTMGCFHSLEPTSDPFKRPSIPVLTPEGFARWQTIHIMLSPDKFVPYLQEAVRKYDVPRPDGGHFPKTLPRECFPEKPDEETELWFRKVERGLEQERQIFKNSPYLTANPGYSRSSEYFSSTPRPGLPQIRRPSDLSRSGSQEYDPFRRRSSVPDLPSPMPPDSAGADVDRHARTRELRKPTGRSQSAQRALNGSSRHRSSHDSQRPSSGHRYSNPPTPSHHPFDPFHNANGQTKQPPRPYHHSRSGSQHHARSPSTIDESSGSEASSEDSVTGRRHHRRHSRDNRRHNSLLPGGLFPSFFGGSGSGGGGHHHRRHSHDDSYVSHEKPPPLPPRPAPRPYEVRNGSIPSMDKVNRGPVKAPYSPVNPRPQDRGSATNTVRFRDHIFDSPREDSGNSGPEPSPVYTKNPPMRMAAQVPQQPPGPVPGPMQGHPQPPPPPPTSRLLLMDENPSGYPLSRHSSEGASGSGTSGHKTDRSNPRPPGSRPLRVATVTGVGGRKYPNTEPRSAGAGPPTAPPPPPLPV